MKKEFETMGFRCYDPKMCAAIREAAANNGLSVPKYIERTVTSVVEGQALDRARIEKLAIDMMKEVQNIRDEHPRVDVSGLERIGELLWQILL